MCKSAKRDAKMPYAVVGMTCAERKRSDLHGGISGANKLGV